MTHPPTPATPPPTPNPGTGPGRTFTAHDPVNPGDPMPMPVPTSPGKHAAFVEPCRLTVEGGDYHGATLRAWLRYDPADPHAAKLAIEPAPNAEHVVWNFARELLRDGLDNPAGYGDVRAFPLGLAHVGIRFSSPEGEFFVSVARSVIARWVSRSYEAVPDGMERFDADGWLDGVLTAT